jgi:hypothetical protein
MMAEWGCIGDDVSDRYLLIAEERPARNPDLTAASGKFRLDGRNSNIDRLTGLRAIVFHPSTLGIQSASRRVVYGVPTTIGVSYTGRPRTTLEYHRFAP